jgi:hypothetical protein
MEGVNADAFASASFWKKLRNQGLFIRGLESEGTVRERLVLLNLGLLS